MRFLLFACAQVWRAHLCLPDAEGKYTTQWVAHGGRTAARRVAEAEQRARAAEARCDGLAAELRELTLSPGHGAPGPRQPQALPQRAAAVAGAAPAAAAAHASGRAPEMQKPMSDPSQAQLPPEAAAALVQGLCAALGVDHGGDPVPGRAQAGGRQAPVLARPGRAKPQPGSGGSARAALAGWGLGRTLGFDAGFDGPARRRHDEERAELERAVAHFQTLFAVPRLAGVLPAMSQARKHARAVNQQTRAERLLTPCITR